MALQAKEIDMSMEENFSPSSSKNRPVDLVHLAKATLGSRSLECEVLALFRHQSKIYFQRLSDAENDKDWYEAAHSLKGSAKAIGAWQIATLAKAAEEMSGQQREEGRKAYLELLKQCMADTNIFIETILAD